MKRFFTFSALLCVIHFTCAQIRCGDAILPYTMEVYKGDLLTLNGAGMRTYMYIDTYAGGLYTKEKTNDGLSVISNDESMAIRLDVVSDFVNQKSLTKSFENGFEYVTNGDTRIMDSRISMLLVLFAEKIQKNDFFDFKYNSAIQTTIVLKNDLELGSIEGLDFKQALFAIWLGDKPACQYIKNGMLGIDG